MPKSAKSAKAAQEIPAPDPKSKSTTPGTEGVDAGLRELFLSELQDIYWAENQLVKALPKMQSAASSGTLAKAIATHRQQTQNHVARLEQVFGILGETPRAKKCFAMEGLTREGEGVVETTIEGSATRDAGIIIASQKVEHYEIAAYGGLVQLARTLGLEDAAALLGQTLAEEKETDQLLTQIAENDINYQSAAEA
jgi:ferritin-like metal-binding protein YciE